MSMDINQKKFNSQIEVIDLIAEAVKNASARRNQAVNAEESLLDLLEEEAKGITGGRVIPDPYTCGMIGTPPNCQ